MTINEVAGEGETPVAENFQQAFNAPNSPWLTLVRNAVLGDGGLGRQGQRRNHGDAVRPVSHVAGAGSLASTPAPAACRNPWKPEEEWTNDDGERSTRP